MKIRLLLIIIISFFGIVILSSEVLLLKNGSVINGIIIKLDADTMTIYTKEEEFILDRDDIKVIFRNYEIYKKDIDAQKEKELKKEVKKVNKDNDLIINGDFESGNYYTERGLINLIWGLDPRNNSYADLEFRDGMAVIYVKDNKNENVNFYQKGILLEKNKRYVLEFQAKSATPVPITANLQHYGMKTPIYYLNKKITLTDKLKHFKYEFKMLKENNHNTRLEFRINTKLRVVYIDNVKLYEKRK